MSERPKIEVPNGTEAGVGPALKTVPAYLVRVSWEALAKVCDDNSDSGYTNIHGGDIIIDLVHIEDRRAEFAETIGIDLEDLPEDGYVLVHV